MRKDSKNKKGEIIIFITQINNNKRSMFYYTNFIMETNQWWLRRVRPLWMGAFGIWAYWIFHRYYFFGKEATKHSRRQTEDELLRRAAHNKRQFGYGMDYYTPTLERSRKKLIMEAMG
jgi:hypothetical protein